MTTPQPWWASPPTEDGERPRTLHTDEDPLEQHLAGRRGDPATDAPGQREPPDAQVDESPSRHSTDFCGVCPICITVRVLEDTRPELLAHLAEAARHLAAAARTLLDPADADGAGDQQATDGHIHRIDLE